MRLRLYSLLALVFILSAPLPASAAISSADLVNSLQGNYYGGTGISTIVGTKPNGGVSSVSITGNTNDSSFRIGSQSKMYTSTVILKMIDGGAYNLSLDSRLNDINANTPDGWARMAALRAALPKEAGDYTIRDFLNMGTMLPNYMAGTPVGSSQSIWDQWIEANYGSVTGFSNTDAHLKLAGLSTPLFPGSPPVGYDNFYSNTNAVVLALMAEAVSGVSFDDLLAHYVLDPLTLNQTGLQMTPGNAGNVGTESGIEVTGLDPTIPWTSGAMTTSMADLLRFLETVNTNTAANNFLTPDLFAARTAAENQNIITMSGMPISYGLGLMSLDWKRMLELGLGLSTADVVSTGHGGSIAGSSSFSGWLTSASASLDLGLAVYANSLSTIDEGGYFTATPSEALFVSMVEHLYRNARANGTESGGVFSYGSTGGYVSQDQQSGSSYAFQNLTPRSTLSLDLTSNPTTPLVVNLDPTYTYYSKATGSVNEAAFTITTGNSLTLPTKVRIEGYGGIQTGTNSFAMLDFQSGSVSDVQGEVAAYGRNAIALRTNESLDLSATSHLFSKSLGGTALHVTGGAEVNVSSQPTITPLEIIRDGIASDGSRSAGLRADDNSTVTVTPGASVSAVTYGYSMDSGFKTVNEWQNAVYGAEISSGAVLNVKGGQITAAAANPWDGVAITAGRYIADTASMPGIAAAGVRLNSGTTNVTDNSLVRGTAYGVLFQNTGNRLQIANSAVAGGLASLKTLTATDATVVADRAVLSGAIEMKDASAASSLTMTNSSLLAPNYNGTPMLAFGGNIDVDASNTFVIPLVFDTILLRDVDVGAVLTFSPTLATISNAFIITSNPDFTQARLSGFTYGGPNAQRMFPAFAELARATVGGLSSDAVNAMALQANRLTAEVFATQGLVSLGLHGNVTESARGLAFPMGGGRSGGMVPTTRLAYEMTPDKAFGQGRVLSSFSQDIRQSISRFQSTAPFFYKTGPEQSGIQTQHRQLADSQSPLSAWTGPLPAAYANARYASAPLTAVPSGAGKPYRFFGGYFYNNQDQSSRSGYYGYETESHGLIFGLGMALSPKLDLAFYTAWADSETDYDSIGSEVETESCHFGLLARYIHPLHETADVRLTGNLDFSRLNNDTSRRILGQDTDGDFDQRIYSAGLEVALDTRPAFADYLRISPFTSVTYTYLDQDSVNEKGLAALHIDSKSIEQFSTVLGISLAKDFMPTDTLVLTPSAAASWRHDFGDADYSVKSNFSGFTTSFSSRSIKQERDALQAGAALDALWMTDGEKILVGKIGYGVSLREDLVDHQLFAGFEIQF
ncbi:autotransporter domain-containing protein [Desulfovibrio sp. OttesenSCG-928-M16]|nr:autotransporter domain-containing protein [Desulfovibrio sp. OttesenSCG-928-M16]